jgi:hypothetical protein
VGTFNAIYGLVAVFRDDYLALSPSGVVILDVTTWGWVTLALGLFQVGAGLAILAGQTWGRIVGIIFAVANAIGQLTIVSVHPFWSTIIIALDVFVIYALTVHGREMAGGLEAETSMDRQDLGVTSDYVEQQRIFPQQPT